MSKEEINQEVQETAPAGDVSLTEEDLDTVAGGMAPMTDGAECTAGDTICHGTCSIPPLTYGCCGGAA